jgi:hypothetical protein
MNRDTVQTIALVAGAALGVYLLGRLAARGVRETDEAVADAAGAAGDYVQSPDNVVNRGVLGALRWIGVAREGDDTLYDVFGRPRDVAAGSRQAISGVREQATDDPAASWAWLDQ